MPTIPDSKVHGANMGPIWGRHDPGGPHVGPMNFAILDYALSHKYNNYTHYQDTIDGNNMRGVINYTEIPWLTSTYSIPNALQFKLWAALLSRCKYQR